MYTNATAKQQSLHGRFFRMRCKYQTRLTLGMDFAWKQVRPSSVHSAAPKPRPKIRARPSSTDSTSGAPTATSSAPAARAVAEQSSTASSSAADGASTSSWSLPSGACSSTSSASAGAAVVAATAAAATLVVVVGAATGSAWGGPPPTLLPQRVRARRPTPLGLLNALLQLGNCFSGAGGGGGGCTRTDCMTCCKHTSGPEPHRSKPVSRSNLVSTS
mmetsp:Transcript_111028/g.353807  ORF Transcript_111028/g.353807 Transcript_111028/m.353807 type:complete len:217 (+) Transcript_111028:429-1079(+)